MLFSQGCPPTPSCHWDRPPGAAFGLVLAMSGHAVGWPFSRGGSQNISNALASYFRSLGGEIVTCTRVESVDDLPPASVTLLDLTPRQVLKVAGHRLPAGYRHKLGRYRYGPGVFKLDWGARWSDSVEGEGVRTRWNRSPRRYYAGDCGFREGSLGRETLPRGRTCWSHSKACSTRPALPKGSIRPGPTATSPTGRASI